MRPIYLYLLFALITMASCTCQDDPLHNTENDSIPLSIGSVVLPNVEIGTRGSIWDANDVDLAIAVYVYPENGYSEQLVHYQYRKATASTVAGWYPMNNQNINLGYGNAKLLVVYPVVLTGITNFLSYVNLSTFKTNLADFILKSTYYNWNEGDDWSSSSNRLKYLASYAVVSGVNKERPTINSVNLKHAYSGLKIIIRKEDTTISYFKNLTVFNNTSGIPRDVKFDFFTQSYFSYTPYKSEATGNLILYYTNAIDDFDNSTVCFFVAPNREGTTTRPMTGSLGIEFTARYKSGKEETRTVLLDLSNAAYKDLATFTAGKQHTITLTWK